MLERIVGFVLLLFTLPAVAQTARPAQSGWVADSKTGCRLWNTAPEPNETASWSGPCVNGLAHGQGVQQWFVNGKPASRYSGNYRNGMKNGYGEITWSSGAHYEGEWKDNKANGRGRYTKISGEHIEGIWTNGCLRQGTERVTVGATRADCGF